MKPAAIRSTWPSKRKTKSAVGAAQSARAFGQGFEHCLQIGRRTADDFEQLGGCRLLLQQFGQIHRALAQFAEQARILDGDDGLGGEVRDQRNLLVGEGVNLLAVDVDSTYHLAILEHRHRNNCSVASQINGSDHVGIAIDVRLHCLDVVNLDRLLRRKDACIHGVRRWLDYPTFLALLGVGRWRIVECHRADAIAVAEI